MFLETTEKERERERQIEPISLKPQSEQPQMKPQQC